MSYSCSDFADDVYSHCVDLGLVRAEDVQGEDDVSHAADLVMAAITNLHAQNAALRAMLSRINAWSVEHDIRDPLFDEAHALL